MSKNTPTKFVIFSPDTAYELWMWSKFNAKWIPHAGFESAEECEKEIIACNSQLAKEYEIPREHWKIVKVLKIYEVV